MRGIARPDCLKRRYGRVCSGGALWADRLLRRYSAVSDAYGEAPRLSPCPGIAPMTQGFDYKIHH
jgi:hypothetical protein